MYLLQAVIYSMYLKLQSVGVWVYTLFAPIFPCGTSLQALLPRSQKSWGRNANIGSNLLCFLSFTSVGPCQPLENLWRAEGPEIFSVVELHLSLFTYSHTKPKNSFDVKLLVSFINLFGNGIKFATWKRRLMQAATFLYDKFTCAIFSQLPSEAIWWNRELRYQSGRGIQEQVRWNLGRNDVSVL